MPAVSVIIPNYNHAAFLRQRIDSVLEQTFQDFEVIILDDCSKDNSKAIIESYKSHPKISHIVYNLENSGSTFRQWKKGIELSQGEWIWIAESDDYCENDFLKKVYSAAVASESVLGFSLSTEVDADNQFIKKRPPSIPATIAQGKDFIVSNMIYQNDIYNASMVIFRKEYIAQNIFEKLIKYKYAGDWLFFGSIIKKGTIIEVHEYLNYFRRHSNNVSNPAMKKGLSFTEGLDAVACIKKNLPIHRIQFIKRWLLKWRRFNNFYHFSLRTNKDIFLKILKTGYKP